MKMLAGLGAAGIVVAGSGELAARQFGFGHPLLYRASAEGYEIVPGQTVVRLGKTTRINALGMRGPETSEKPASGVARVMVLGDSVANGGTMINDDQTIGAQLQKQLRSRGLPAEVVTVAAGGWAVGNERGWLQKNGTFGARVIVLEVNENDLDQMPVPAALLDHHVSFPTRAPASALGEVAVRYVMPKLGLGGPTADPGATAGAMDARAAADVRSQFASICDYAQRAGVRLVVLYWDVLSPKPTPDIVAAREAFLQMAHDRRVQVLRPQLNLAPNASALFRDRIHPDAEGNVEVAARIAPNIAEALNRD
ncbi:MAG TPA: GDSL-type esterase/lipase family protein [Novosphingobium sp.]|nr:GDSL-type esterase/lipase family protein [Novosphingobium sp.]